MITHRINLFPINNLSELNCTYRLLEITNLPEKHPTYLENIHRLAGMVASSIRKPVCVYWEDKKAYLATTASIDKIKLQWRLTPHIAKLVPKSTVYKLDYSNIGANQVKLALRLLSYHIRSALIKTPELWNDTSRTFYFREPMNFGDNTQVDVLRGFTYQLHYLSDCKIYISLDLIVRYIDRISLLERLNDGEEINDFKMQHFLYKFGLQWYRIQLINTTGNSIKEQLFTSDRDNNIYNVFDYTLQHSNAPHLDEIKALNHNSPAISYKYPNKNIERYGAASLCFKTYKTNDPQVSSLHKHSILKPHERLQKSEDIISKYFHSILFANRTKLDIASQAYKKTIENFKIPDLLFGNQKVLQVKVNTEETGINIQDYGKSRLNWLLNKEIGLFTRESLQPQYLFIPNSLNSSIARKFQENFITQMEKFLSRKYSIKTIIYNDREAKNLYQQVEAIKQAVEDNNIDRGRGFLILPESAHSGLHNYIKRELFDTLQFQCADAAKLKHFFCSSNEGYILKENKRRKFISYLRNAALGMLLVNRQWAFALKDPLYYDVYIGIDVLNDFAGFTYIYNGGKKCYFRHYPVNGEKLTKKQIFNILKKDLQKDISELKLNHKSIVIHRDGRSYHEEEQGFFKAIELLKEEGFLAENIQIGVVEIHKTSSARIRLYYEENGRISNPSIGDYFIINDQEGTVCTTGNPFKFPGTANPLHILIAYGNLDIAKVLRDVFSLAQLAAWAAPDKAVRNPVTIKIGDTFIEHIASDSDTENALYSEYELDEEELET